jgi:hypothetical protein
VREGIRDLADALSGDAKRLHAERADYVASVGKRMAAWKAGVMERLTSSETPINVARMLHELNGAMPADGILVADGGFAAHWAGLLYDTKQAGRGFVPIAALPRSATACPAPSARRWQARAGRRCRSPATAASTCRWATWKRRGAWACRSPSSSSTTRPRAT